MGKKAHLDIKESMSELQKVLAKQKSFNSEKRVRCLIEIKSTRFDTRQELANYLCIHKRTLEKWVNNYKSGVLLRFCPINQKSNNPKLLPQLSIKGLSKRSMTRTTHF